MKVVKNLMVVALATLVSVSVMALPKIDGGKVPANVAPVTLSECL